MKPKDRKPSQKTPQQSRAEKKATKKFYVELQKAIDKVDWGKVKVARLRGGLRAGGKSPVQMKKL